MFRLILFVTAMSCSAFAEVDRFTVPRSADLTEVHADPLLEKQLGGKITGAHVSVNVPKREGELDLYVMPACEEGVACPRNIRLEQLRFTIVSYVTNPCGSKEIVAKHDEHQPNIGLSILTVTDNLQNHCPTPRMISPTEVVYETEQDGQAGEKTRSTFSGPAL